MMKSQKLAKPIEYEMHDINGERYVKMADVHKLIDMIDDLNLAIDMALDHIEQYSDVEDGDYGVPFPNKDMRMISEIEEMLGRKETW